MHAPADRAEALDQRTPARGRKSARGARLQGVALAITGLLLLGVVAASFGAFVWPSEAITGAEAAVPTRDLGTLDQFPPGPSPCT